MRIYRMFFPVLHGNYYFTPPPPAFEPVPPEASPALAPMLFGAGAPPRLLVLPGVAGMMVVAEVLP
jgi:hypothetical protein